jgi:hypothetical protein
VKGYENESAVVKESERGGQAIGRENDKGADEGRRMCLLK